VSYTVGFDEIGKDDLALAGGKGANLGELSRAGLPVPPGFVVAMGLTTLSSKLRA
jgi:pyruvate,water dikinase